MQSVHGKKCGESDVKDTPVTNVIVYSTVVDVGLGYAGFHKLTENMSMKPYYTHIHKSALKRRDRKREREGEKRERKRG